MPWFDRLVDSEGTTRQTFEWNSRGGRAVADLILPMDADRPLPVALLCGPAGRARDDASVTRDALTVAPLGYAVVALELPLHGARENPKLSPRLLTSLTPGTTRNPLDAELWRDLARQTHSDLRGALDVLADRPEVDTTNACWMGVGLGAALGAGFAAEDERVRTCVVAELSGGAYPAPIDPLAAVRAMTPRPVLVCGAEQALGDHVTYTGENTPLRASEPALRAFLGGS